MKICTKLIIWFEVLLLLKVGIAEAIHITAIKRFCVGVAISTDIFRHIRKERYSSHLI